jgi:hypothetical protein
LATCPSPIFTWIAPQAPDAGGVRVHACLPAAEALTRPGTATALRMATMRPVPVTAPETTGGDTHVSEVGGQAGFGRVRDHVITL